MQKLSILIICCLFFGGIVAENRLPGSLDKILEQFDGVYKQRESLFNCRVVSIDSLKYGVSRMPNDKRLSRYEEIGEAYRKVKVDSAAFWFESGAQLANELGDKVKAQHFTLKKIALWPEMGMIDFSANEFDSIRANGIYEANYATFYEEGARMFAYTAWCTSYDNFRDMYQRQSNELNDSLSALLADKNSSRYKLSKALHAYHTGNEKRLVEAVRSIMDSTPESDYRYSEAITLLGVYYKDKGKMDQAIYYLTKAATSDMIYGRMESSAMEELINVFEDSGDLSRASQCAIAALQNANSSGANRRILHVLEPIPNVLTAAKNKNNRMIVELYCLIGVLFLGLVCIIVLVIKYRAKIRNLHTVKDQLARANYMKEAYMNRFMGLCSMYMQKTSDFMRFATRKINAGQYEDLFSHIRSGKLLDEQSQLFYDNFDDVFVKVFPTFVHDVNELLLPDKRITLPDNMVLNTELRILAFTRLGITDGPSVARFLDLSLNTIYTYRNKLRNRAIDRDTFEKNVMNIGKIH